MVILLIVAACALSSQQISVNLAINQTLQPYYVYDSFIGSITVHIKIILHVNNSSDFKKKMEI